jgi:hypothetical protein
MGSGAAGVLIGDFSGHVLDHTQLPFIRGGTLQAPSHGYSPVGNFGAVPKSVETKWSSAWKKAAIHYYDRAGRLAFQGERLAYKGNFMDLDPTYTDRNGDPLLRMTLDWRDNERRMADFAIAKSIEIARAMGATDFTPSHGLGSYDARVLPIQPLTGRNHHGEIFRKFGGQSLFTALANIEPFHFGWLDVSAKFFRASHSSHARSYLSHC